MSRFRHSRTSSGFKAGSVIVRSISAFGPFSFPVACEVLPRIIDGDWPFCTFLASGEILDNDSLRSTELTERHRESSDVCT